MTATDPKLNLVPSRFESYGFVRSSSTCVSP